MIEKIRKSIEQGKFETNIYLQFTRLHLQEDCLSLVLSIFLDKLDKAKLAEQWNIECRGWGDYRLDNFLSYEEDEFEMTDEHPCLWDYQKPLSELYFRGQATNVKALIGDLYIKHKSLTNNTISLEHYLNTETGPGDLEWLLSSGQGLFSAAPEILTEAYQELLELYGFSTHLLFQKVTLSNEGFKLLRLGPSYIIAKEFAVEKIDSKILGL